MTKAITRVRKRKLSDSEIAIAKAMLAKGLSNDKVHFYFNRADRLISSGRIAQIKKGRYGATVPAASQAEVDAFLHAWAPTQSNATAATNPQNLAGLFSCTGGEWFMRNDETDTIECKLNFRLNPEIRFADVIRSIAGLANNEGGYILFGVENATFKATGMSNEEFSQTDPAMINRTLSSALDPVPRVTKSTITVGGKILGILRVDRIDAGPVIALKNIGGDVKEGGIYYRYVGETRLIKPGELRQVIEKRIQRGLAAFAQRMTRIATGTEATLNLETGVVEGTTGRLLIDRDLLRQVQFIREGDFTEIKGAPALRVVGDVEPTSQVERERVKIIRDNVTADAVIRNFLRDERVSDPLQYLHAQLHQQRKWMPIWYYLRLSGLSGEQLIQDLRGMVVTHPASRDAVISRVRQKTSAYKAHPGKPAILLTSIVDGDVVAPSSSAQDANFAMAIQGLPKNFERADRLKLGLLNCLDRAQGSDTKSSGRRSIIYRAASRLDEILFGSG